MVIFFRDLRRRSTIFLQFARDREATAAKTVNANSVKKQRINAKTEPSKCSGLEISRRRQIYARIGVELRPQG